MQMTAIVLLIGSTLSLVAYGAGIYPWTVCLPAVAFSLFHFVASWRQSATPHRPPSAAPVARIEHVFAALLVFLLITLVPLPLPLTVLTGMHRYTQNSRVAAALTEAADLGLAGTIHPWFALSRNSAGTLRMLVLIVAAFGSGFASALLPSRWRVGYLRFLVYLAAAIAVAGYIGQWKLPQGFTLWWVIPMPRALPGPVACFVNPNHFAGFLAILSPAAMLLAVDDATHRRWGRAGLSALCFIAMGLAILFSLSRGGLLAYACGLATASALTMGRRRAAACALIACLGALVVVGAATFPDRALRGRLATLRNPMQTESFRTRVTAWRGALQIWARYPVVGAGANGFRMEYPQIRTTSSRAFMTHPENEYVQLLAEAGLVGLCLAIAMGLALAQAARASATGPSPPAHLLTTALAGALVAAAVHACVEFALHLPLYTLVLASLFGLALEAPPLPSPSPAPNPPTPRLARVRACGVPILSLATALLLLANAGPMRVVGSVSHRDTGDIRRIARDMVWAPASVAAWRSLGGYAEDQGTPETKRFGERCVSQAAAYNPKDYTLWVSLGELRLRIGDKAGARQAYATAKALRSWIPVPDILKE